MAASLKLVIAILFLVLTPSVWGWSFAAADSAVEEPSAPPECTWVKVDEEMLCNGKTFIYEAQDTIFSARWFLDMGVVGFLVIFAGT